MSRGRPRWIASEQTIWHDDKEGDMMERLADLFGRGPVGGAVLAVAHRLGLDTAQCFLVGQI